MPEAGGVPPGGDKDDGVGDGGDDTAGVGVPLAGDGDMGDSAGVGTGATAVGGG